MKEGFIERIEGNNVYVVFDDEVKVFSKEDFPDDIALDMRIVIKKGKMTIKKPSQKLKKEIDEITDELFVPFSKK